MPAGPSYAFPLRNVAPADEKTIRKSEANLVDLRGGSVLLAYASRAGLQSHSSRAPTASCRLFLL